MHENDINFVKEMVETFLVSFVILIIIYKFVAFPEVVVGASMEPTLTTGERILVERVSKSFKDFQRGDIVVLHPPGDDNIDYVKRIVGLPNEIVKINDCKIYISKNGEKFQVHEEYIDPKVCTKGNTKVKDGRAVRLSSEEYLVLGDNRDNSADSRIFGLVEKERILGKVVFRFWPAGSLGFL